MIRTSIRLAALVGLLTIFLALSQKASVAEPSPKPAVDLYDDALPLGAIARFGTLRLRQESGVRSLAVSPDGSLLASAGRFVKVWNAKTGQEIERFRGKSEAEAVAFTPDGKILLTGNCNGRIQHWEISSGKLLHEFQSKENESFFHASFSPDRSVLILGKDNSKAILLDVANGQQLHILEKPEGINDINLSPDGKLAATVGHDRLVRLWDLRTGKVLRELTVPESWQWSVKFSPDSKLVAASSYKVGLRVWEVSNSREMLNVPEAVGSLTFSPDGRTILVSRDNMVRLVEATTGKVLRGLQGHRDSYICHLAFFPDGRLAAGAEGRTIRLWDTHTGKTVLAFPGHHGEIVSLAFSPDGKSLASGSYGDGTLIVWDVKTTRPRYVFDEHNCGVSALAWSPDGSVLASGDGAGGTANWEAVIRFFDPGEGKLRRQFPAHLNCIRSLAYSTDGKRLVSVGWDARARVWDTTTCERLVQMRGDELMKSAAFSRDGKIVFLSNWYGGNAETYRMEDWQILYRLEVDAKGPADCHHVALLPDGKAFVSRESRRPQQGTPVEELCYRSVEDGHLLRSVPLPGAARLSLAPCALSVDGQLYAEPDRKQGFQVWDTVTGKRVTMRSTLGGDVTALAFSADGRMLATGNDDTTVLVWSMSEALLKFLWAELTAESPSDAARAVERLTATPQDTLPWIAERMRKVPDGQVKAARLIAQLNDDDFTVREKASQSLADMGGAARFALELASVDHPARETRRRIEELLSKLPARREDEEALDGRQAYHAVTILQQLGTAEARELLRDLAKGPEELPLARVARVALQRLENSKPSEKERSR